MKPPYPYFWLKWTDRPAYIQRKLAWEAWTRDRRYERDSAAATVWTAELPARLAALRREPVAHFRHSGNAGDLIYALPALRALAAGRPARLTLRLHQPGLYPAAHPLGNVMLNEGMAARLRPLLLAQSYLQTVDTGEGDEAGYDLDLFRQLPLPFDRGDIVRWYFYVFNVFPDPALPWLTVAGDQRYADSIVLARSERYHNPNLHFEFLRAYPRVVFVGVEQEYRLMQAQIPQLEWVPVPDFLALAQVIAGARLFVGNQSFPYALAEAMKVPRILEMYYRAPNVVIHGPRGHDVYFQAQFEEVVRQCWEYPSLADS